MSGLLSASRVDVRPREFVASVGQVFATFAQESGSRSFGVEADGHRFFVKTAGAPGNTKTFQPHGERVEILRNAVLIAGTCSHPALTRLRNVIESPDGPMLVYDWIHGEALNVPRAERKDPTSSFQRFRALPVQEIHDALDVVYDVHHTLCAAGWVAVDFYDGSLLYDFASSRIHVIDVDNYNRGPFHNTMGRMFGSSRFMSPEEFELGALVDERTTVFVMGRTGLVFLGEPGDPGEPGRNDAEPARPDAFRGTHAAFDVLSKASERDPAQRFESVASFYAAWRAVR